MKHDAVLFVQRFDERPELGAENSFER